MPGSSATQAIGFSAAGGGAGQGKYKGGGPTPVL